MRTDSSSVLSLFLWIGGIPPILSGITAALFPDVYLQFTGAEQFLDPHGHATAVFLLSLQGGDAFVAGTARIIGAIWGNLSVKRFLAATGIVHSGFEIWLLLSTLMDWQTRFPREPFDSALLVEIWFFVALHGLLVMGFTYGLIQRDGPTSMQTTEFEKGS
ncbi:MAG: hypothetical protein KDA80_22320 [Planctomycetaceae bacterium]|nr:hypothetical protein [Planctomycetaceae bacterium]